MKLYYYIDQRGNFGDDLNPWLWGQLIPSFLDDIENELFVGIGTLLSDRIPAGPKKYVFGSGIGYGGGPPIIDETWKFYCVRGPITAQRLGLSEKMAITDGAMLVPTVFDARQFERSGVGFIPHHVSAWNFDWGPLCEEVGIRYIDPRRPVEDVLKDIAKSSCVITEAMHGAILSDAFRIPWMPVIFYDHILRIKWLDWTQSLGIPFEPVFIKGVYSSDHNYSMPDRVKISVKRSLSNFGLTSKGWTPPPFLSSRCEIDEFRGKFRALVSEPRLFLSSDSSCNGAVGRLMEKLEEFKLDRTCL